MAFTQVTVTGTINDPSGQPIEGANVEFALSQNLFDAETGTVLASTPQIVQTDVDGNFSIVLLATDDPTTMPRGQVYSCKVLIAGNYAITQFGVNTAFPLYYFALPASAAPTATFASLIFS